ncbi:hypothetical protein BU16DRAFT_616522 [Lophium mytilinum]|uniref:Uncharacterized protein n=1 Tax=Lophium mytilinum TaxID=390894 RepID=A0A6A6QZU2_9PEZI|nr:hypothetical protein BU16DRAFT_616522 [Lophium mytilinum]
MGSFDKEQLRRYEERYEEQERSRRKAYEEEARKVAHRAEVKQRAEREAQQVEDARTDRLHWTGAAWEDRRLSQKPDESYATEGNISPVSHNPWDAAYETLNRQRQAKNVTDAMKRLGRTLAGKEKPPPQPEKP